MVVVGRMARKKTDRQSSKDRHKPRTMVGIRDHFKQANAEACRLLGVTLAEFANMAVREKLERMGLWPSPPQEQFK